MKTIEHLSTIITRFGIEPSGDFEHDLQRIQKHLEKLKETDPEKYLKLGQKTLTDLKLLHELVTKFAEETKQVAQSAR